MNPEIGHFRRPLTRRWLPGAGRSIRWLTVAVLIALAAPVEAQQAPGSTYGPVRRADTLWELALRFRGEARVSAQQAMIALLRANPEAFVDGNINALRTGVTLRVPTAADMAAVTPDEAAAEFARHEEAWRNRGRTGSASPGPGPQAPPRPASPSAEGTPEGGEDVAEELREARETVTELRDRLSERDEAIEDLLVQLAVAQRELRDLRAKVGPAPSGESPAAEEEAAEEDAAPAASWLPVSPLILGSSLIVLLVLIVVVTLLRQRGEAEEALLQEPLDEGGEDAYDERYDGDDESPGPEDEWADDPYPPMEEAPGAERRAPEPSRTGAVRAATVIAASTASERGLAGDDEAMESREEETADLPIGMDLEGEDPWDPAPEGSAPDRSEPRGPGGPPEFDRHVEVGELDDLEIDAGPAPVSLPDVSTDLGEGDGPPEDGAASGRSGRGQRE